MAALADHDAYLAALPPDRAARLSDLRHRLAERLPDTVEVISYSMPAFRRPGGKVVIGYAGWRAHYALYPHSGNALSEIGPLPEGVEVAKGTLRCAWDRVLPDALLDRILAARRAELS